MKRAEAPGVPTDLPPVAAGGWSEAIRFCTVVFLVVRIAVSLLGVATVRDAPPLAPVGFPTSGYAHPVLAGWHNLVEGTYRWDAGWFTHIAQDGYSADDGSAEFYPAFPLLVRAAAWATPFGPIGAGILVATIACWAGLVVLYVLTSLERSREVARRTVILLMAYPGSLILLSPFSESLFLLATVLAFLWVRRGRWGLGGVAGAAAAATRAVGVLLVPAFLVEAWGTPDRKLRTRRLLLATVPALGLASYLAWWWIHAGDPTVPLRAPELWGRTWEFPLTMLGRSVALGLEGAVTSGGWPWTMDLLVTGALVVPLAIWWRGLRPSYLLYAGLTFLVVLTVTYPPRPLVGAPRYACVVFPAFWLLAERLHGRAFVAATAVSAAAYVLVAVTFMNQRTFLF